MRLELANTGNRRWWSEGGASQWGFGVEVTHYGSEHWDEAIDQSTLESEGHQVAILLGPWSIVFYSEASFKAIHSDDVDLYRRIEVMRP